MSMMEWVAAAQSSGLDTPRSNSNGAGYFVIALLAVAVGLVVLILIRSGARRASKR
jgi:hypothetical protein